MRAEIAETLTEAIYDAAIVPDEWHRVMAILKREFATGAETLYGLDFARSGLRTLHIEGIDVPYYGSFEGCYYRDDNPCIHSEPLHRPGVVRTDQKLLAFFNDPHILRRSIYYNDWMRPQQLEHSMGTTLMAEGDNIVNLSLFRSTEVGAFSDGDIEIFGRFCDHLRRSLRMAMRLGTYETLRSVSIELLDTNPVAVLLLDAAGRAIFANRAARALDEAGDGLRLGTHGLVLLRRSDSGKLAQLIGQALAGRSGGAMPALRPSGKRPYSIMVSPLSPAHGAAMPQRPAACIVIADPEAAPVLPVERLRQLYALTPAESALAVRLVAGDDLRTAAETLGILYSTARTQLSAIFRKTDTSRQGELVRILLSTALLPNG